MCPPRERLSPACRWARGALDAILRNMQEELSCACTGCIMSFTSNTTRHCRCGMHRPLPIHANTSTTPGLPFVALYVPELAPERVA